MDALRGDGAGPEQGIRGKPGARSPSVAEPAEPMSRSRASRSRPTTAFAAGPDPATGSACANP